MFAVKLMRMNQQTRELISIQKMSHKRPQITTILQADLWITILCSSSVSTRGHTHSLQNCVCVLTIIKIVYIFLGGSHSRLHFLTPILQILL